MKVVSWAELEAEIPVLVADCGADAAEVATLIERMSVGQERLEAAIGRGDDAARQRIEAKLSELHQVGGRLDVPHRRLLVIRAMFVARNAASREAKVAVVAPGLSIAAAPL